MTTTQMAVIALASLGIAWANWYFFLAKRASAVAATDAGIMQEVQVSVRGGYDPAVIRLKKGQPVRLVFDRQETSSCSEELVIPDFGVRRFLPAYERTVVEFTPEEAGTHEFTCGMSMLRGKLVVVDENG